MKASIAVLCLLFMASVAWFSPARATLIMYTDRSVFEGLGDIAENFGFEGDLSGYGGVFHGDHWTMPEPWTAHGMTYSSPGNWTEVLLPVFGPEGPVSNVLDDAHGQNLWGYVDAGSYYDMLGMDLGTFWYPSEVASITIHTNLDFYTFILDLPASSEMAFHGWTADPGEHIMQFTISSMPGPQLDNVTLGRFGAPVPEPSTLALLAPAVAAYAVWRRRKRA